MSGVDAKFDNIGCKITLFLKDYEWSFFKEKNYIKMCKDALPKYALCIQERHLCRNRKGYKKITKVIFL